MKVCRAHREIGLQLEYARRNASHTPTPLFISYTISLCWCSVSRHSALDACFEVAGMKEASSASTSSGGWGIGGSPADSDPFRSRFCICEWELLAND